MDYEALAFRFSERCFLYPPLVKSTSPSTHHLATTPEPTQHPHANTTPHPPKGRQADPRHPQRLDQDAQAEARGCQKGRRGLPDVGRRRPGGQQDGCWVDLHTGSQDEAAGARGELPPAQGVPANGGESWSAAAAFLV